MAWQGYVDHMTAGGIQMGGIYGMDGNPWGVTPNMKATPQEVTAVINGIKGQNFANGVFYGGVKHTMLRMAEDSVTAKCRTAPDDQKYLMHACLGKTCVLIGGICGPNERNATMVVENLRDHLGNSNY